MENFLFNASTNIFFGKDEIKKLPEILSKLGKRVLLTYGGGSIKKIGIYDEAINLLKANNFTVFELSGIQPNPRVDSVREGAQICKQNNIDVVLAIGGGSTLDCSKVIAAAACYDGDGWDLVLDSSKILKALPLVTVLTLAGTGSEMNAGAVISNLQTNEKLGVGSPHMIPVASILDPQYLYSLPNIQTACGTADIMSHIIEQYFNKDTTTFVQDQISEGLLITCIKYAKIALDNPENYEARSNLMWASSLALNGLCGRGRQESAWSCHPIEHELSAYYDITHGLGLAIVTPRWMRNILNNETVDKFVQYAVNVWKIPESSDKFDTALKGIDATEQFFKDCKIPMTLTEIGIDDSKFDIMAKKAIKFGHLQYSYVPLDYDLVVKILRDCL